MQKRGIEILATSEDVPQRQSSADSHLAISKPIEFQVLGPTEARRAGQQIPLSGARRRALLTRLLLDTGRAVSAETLIEDVWDGHAPSAASATLQSHVSQLRKVLGDRLRRSAAGYLLRLDAATVDAAEFEGGLANGATHMAEGDAHEAAGSLREALLLWRGRALQDVADRPWARPEAERLEELRRIAVEQLLQARLESGEHQQVVPDAEVAVEENPLREQRWAILMLALYRSGRQADALRAYRRLRNLLADELGIDPSPPLTALEAAVLRQDPGLQPPVVRGRGATTKPDDAGATLAQAHRAAGARNWRSACELLCAADRIAPLDENDLEPLGDAAFMAARQDTSIAARKRAHSLWLRAGDRPRAAVAAEAHALLDEALAWAASGQLGSVATGQIFCWSTQSLLAVADFHRAAEWIEAIESSGIGGIPGDCQIHRAEVLRATGQHDRAREEALNARAELQAIDLLHTGIAHYELGMIHLVQREFDLAEQSFRHARACGADTQPGLALLRLARGDTAGAATSIQVALDDANQDELRRVPLLSAAVQIALGRGDNADAARHVRDLEAIAGRFGSVGLLAGSVQARARVTYN